jgi:hypothetical protein
MALDFQTTAGGATSIFSISPLVLDNDLTVRDLVVSLNGTLVTNWNKTGTSEITFATPLPNGSLVFQRVTPAVRKFQYVTGTFMDAGQVNLEFDEVIRNNAEMYNQSYLRRYTPRTNIGKVVTIDTDGTETLTSPFLGQSLSNPGPIGGGTPDAGQFTTLTTQQLVFNGTQAQKDDSATSLGVSNGFRNFKNAIINGDMGICSRAQTGIIVNPVDSQYLLDRWRYRQAGSAATITVSQQKHAVGQTLVPGEPQYFMRFVQTVAPGTSNGFAQRIEDVRSFAGQTINISFFGKFDTSRPLNLGVTQFFGTGGSPSLPLTVTAVSLGLTSTMTRINVGVNIPSIAGKTLGTNVNSSFLEIDFGFPLTGSFTFEVSDVQVEQVATGGTPTRFERRPPSVESLLCQRYARPVYLNILGIAASASNSAWQQINLAVPMRVPPVRGVVVRSGTQVNQSAFIPVIQGDSYPSAFTDGEIGCLGFRAEILSVTAGTFYLADYIIMAESEL